MKKIVLTPVLMLISLLLVAQQPQHVEPPFWWAGMKHVGAWQRYWLYHA